MQYERKLKIGLRLRSDIVQKAPAQLEELSSYGSGSAQKPAADGHGHLTCQFTDLFCKAIIYISYCYICPGALALPVKFKSAHIE